MDCCYSGAFAGELLAKGDTTVGTNERLGGKGRIVITASDAMQYAFEGDHIDGKGTPSVFTNILVDGLQTGKADIDGDGHVTIDELYDYVYNQITQKTPHQKPEKSAIGVQGEIIIARNPHPREIPLPTEILQAIESPLSSVRVAIIDELSGWLMSGNKGKVLSAQKALERLKHDDSRRVSTKALQILSSYTQSQSSVEAKDTVEQSTPVAVVYTTDAPSPGEKKSEYANSQETQTEQQGQDNQENSIEEAVVPQPGSNRVDTSTRINKKKSRLIWLLPSIMMPFVIGGVIATIFWPRNNLPIVVVSPGNEETYKAKETPVYTQAKQDLVRIPGGYFNMGSSEGEDDEKTVHQVYVNDFYMGKYEVTKEEFEEFHTANNYITDAEKSGGSYIWDGKNWVQKKDINWSNSNFEQTNKHPVVCISWNDAIEYCNWRSKKEGLTPVYTIKGNVVSADFNARGYRLPTEAEWEYAARSGEKGYKYSWGNGTPDGKQGGNIADEAGKRINGWAEEGIWKGYDDGYAYTAPVGSFEPNEFGLCDMTGNVWEWCWDWYDKDYYKNSPKRNPQGPSSGISRVVRGGSWDTEPKDVRAADRSLGTPDNSDNLIGFRLSRTF